VYTAPKQIGPVMRQNNHGQGLVFAICTIPVVLPGCRDIAVELRDECLNQEIFYSLKEAQIVIQQRRKNYSTVRSCGSLRISTTGAADDEPVPHSARSGCANAIISPSRWYKKIVKPMAEGKSAPEACRDAGISQHAAELRDGCCRNHEIFYSLKEAQVVIE